MESPRISLASPAGDNAVNLRGLNERASPPIAPRKIIESPLDDDMVLMEG